MRLVLTIGCVVMAVGLARPVNAVDTGKESEDACIESAKNGPATPQLIVKKVEEAAALVAKEGKAAFPKFKGKKSPFLFNGTYIWIHEPNGKMLMHPIKLAMEGKNLLNLKDKNGKLFFVEMNKIALSKGSGWSEYVWPKPGEKESSPKVSYVKLVKHGNESFILGCGAYDMTLEDVKKAGLSL